MCQESPGNSYYNHASSWAAAQGAGASAASLAAALPWHVSTQAENAGGHTDGWHPNVSVLIDRSALQTHYSDHDTSGDLDGAHLHNTYFLQCLTGGKQEAGSASAFSSVVSNSKRPPSEGGIASCVR